jgi:aspartyl protease family protein
MMRFAWLGLVVMAAAAFPAFYTSNPQLFHSAFGKTPAGAETVATLKTPAQKKSVSGRKVTVAADAQGHFVTEFKMNGKRITALVDTGATSVAINKSTAQRLGIALSPDDFTGIARTANGEARYAPAIIGTIEVGRIRVENVQAAVLEDKALENVLIGMSFLNKLKSFNVSGGELSLQQ